MEKQEGQAELDAAVEAAEAAIDAATKLADKYGLAFDMLEQTYVGDNGHRLTVDDYWNDRRYDDLEPENEDDAKFFDEDGNLLEDGGRWDEWNYAGWQSSSTFC